MGTETGERKFDKNPRVAKKKREGAGFRLYQSSGVREGDYVEVESRFEGKVIGASKGILNEFKSKEGRVTAISVGNQRIRFSNLDSIKKVDT